MTRVSSFFLKGYAIVVLACALSLLCASVVTVEARQTTTRNHHFYFGRYGGSGVATDGADVPAPSSRRYVQLSNGSRFVCETTGLSRHDPPTPSNFPLDLAMKHAIDSVVKSGGPCTHFVDEQSSVVLCWGKEVRIDRIAARQSRFLGRHNASAAPSYWEGEDAFGPYMATAYDEGDECVYTKEPTETELRLYCRYTEMENPVPYMTIHEEKQCRFVLRVMSSKFCYVPALDHSVETERVHCRVLE